MSASRLNHGRILAIMSRKAGRFTPARSLSPRTLDINPRLPEQLKHRFGEGRIIVPGK